MRYNKIKVFYTEKQVLQQDSRSNFSKSPLKPKLLLAHMIDAGLGKNLDVTPKFRPYNAYDFQVAHTNEYVTDFFTGTGRCGSNGLEWSAQFADSVRYTNGSLYAAIENCILHPSEVSFSPTSGFHHASPERGSGFCTFSGQVIASVKAWRKYGAVGSYIDLDGHFGNSIGDSRDFQPDLNSAVPEGFNFNTHEYEKRYLGELKRFICNKLQPAILKGEIDYVVWCHGADSHIDDAIGGQVSTAVWLKCADFFWSWVKKMDELLGRPLPVACALFGGYRSDDYNSVLSLHASDLVLCMTNLLDLDVCYETQVKANGSKRNWEDPFAGAGRNYSLVRGQYSVSNDSLAVRKRSLDSADDYMRTRKRNEDEDTADDLVMA